MTTTTLYLEWLKAVDAALEAAGFRGVWGYEKKPLPDDADDEIELSAADVDRICKEAGVPSWEEYAYGLMADPEVDAVVDRILAEEEDDDEGD